MIIFTAALSLIVTVVVVALAGVATSSGSIHSLGGHFVLSGHQLGSLSAGKPFPSPIVVRIADLRVRAGTVRAAHRTRCARVRSVRCSSVAGSGAATWRVLLALGAVPAAAVIYLRCRMPESPRYQAQVQGRAEQAASQIPGFTGRPVHGGRSGDMQPGMGLRAFSPAAGG